MVDSRVYPKLERVPGKQNWVDYAGGLPSYIERIAKHLHYEKGMSISRAIAVAVNTVKRWARMGKVAKYGDPNHKHVSAKTAALAAKAVAEWEAKRVAGRAAMAAKRVINNSEVSEEYAQHLYDELSTVDLAEYDTRDWPRDGAGSTPRGTLRVEHVDFAEGGMDIQALAERAGAIEDPIARANARRLVLDLAVSTSRRNRLKAKGMTDPHGGFPLETVEDVKNAIRAIGRAKNPALEKRRIMRKARALGVSNLIPDTWSMSLAEAAMSGLLDLASTIAPRNPSGLATDGRRRYKRQGKWGHGFVPLDRAAAESKAKGSPIAMRRIARKYTRAAKGRAGQRSAPVKNNPPSVAVDEKTQPGAESAKSLGQLRTTPFAGDKNRNRLRTKRNSLLPTTQKEASKSSRVPNRARQNWDEIPANLKTVRNGKRYVYAEYGGKGYVTPWVGGVQQVTATPLDQRKVYRTLAPADAANMTSAQLRDIINNPKTTPAAKAVARKQLKKNAVANRTKEASQKP